MNQKSDFWSWNYWERNSPDSKDTPYPDDLDDTCCAATALIGHNSKIVSVKAVAKIINLLAFCESREGGPYHTWIMPPDADKSWKDIDLAVNSNVAFFLSLQEVTLPGLIALTEKAIASAKYNSPYYHSPYAVIYFISRWYKGKKKDQIISYLLKNRLNDYSWGNPLETALAVSALINLGCQKESVEESLASILKNRIDGEWKSYPLVIEEVKNKQKYYSGSAELTTAFCLEVLGKFLSFDAPVKSKGKIEADSKQRVIRKKIKVIANQRFLRFNSEIKDRSLLVRKKILRGDRKLLITLLPYFLDKALGEKHEIKKETLVQLGAASLYGWMAYTIYDDFFDGEGNSKFLSLANICLRELVSIYNCEFSKDEEFLEFFKDIMDRIDAANAWEAANCRAQKIGSKLMIPDRWPDFGNMEKLADRSIGHALGSAAVLYLYTGNIRSSEMENLMAFFENYIIARQLNDDAHDWEKDLKRGQLSPAVVSVLQRYLKRDKNKNTKELDLKKEIKELQKIFWHEVVQEVCGKTLSHIEKAKRHLAAIAVMKNKAVFEGMLEVVEKSAQEATTEQKEMLEFLEGYG
ncbi:MAG: hypothetical protein A2259_01645 [Candidatus Moranbacteria bacterium RIFOXYA2_FULL_43_15]|nr:MAG: hypothetical protein A2259_01645 [Candidatus Moranbacteria bacterium RIFOXYA2_FULL_43_15]